MRYIIATLLVSCSVAFPAISQDKMTRLFLGAQNVDWDAVSFDIGDGQSAQITAINTTKNPANGNTAYIDIYVNGQFQTGTNTDGHSFGQDAVRAKTTFIIRNPGRYVVEIQCTNRKADAESCALSGTGVKIVHVP